MLNGGCFGCIFFISSNRLYNNNGVLFHNGVWAEKLEDDKRLDDAICKLECDKDERIAELENEAKALGVTIRNLRQQIENPDLEYLIKHLTNKSECAFVDLSASAINEYTFKIKN